MEGLFVILLIIGGIVILVLHKNRKSAEAQKRKTERQKQAEERKRLEACAEVVSFFSNNLGYIAKQCITRDELEELIDGGSTAEELSYEIAEKILERDGIILGYHNFGSNSFPVKLTPDFRDKHVYVIGKSGYGKTNLLRNMIFQDLEAGYGIGVIAPEQEMLTEEILPYIPEHRLADVIYFNPTDTQRPIVFNPLELDEGEDIDLRVDETFTILRRVFGEGGPRMDEILRQTLYALLEKPKSTFLDVERLLDRGRSDFRNEVIKTSKDPQTAHFFRDTYPQFPKDSHLPITNRLGRITRPKVVRNCLCQPKGSLNFRKAMDEGKILLFNLSDGILGETTSQLLGQLIVSKFQMATMSRADTLKYQRKPFYLYIDEFQTFTSTTATSYEKILSRARKYKLSLILAHQQTGQIPLELLREIFGNVSTIISFQLSQNDASKLAKEFITDYEGEILSLRPEDLLNLKVGQAYCRIGQNSFLMNTELADQRPDKAKAERIIRESSERYGVLVKETSENRRIEERRDELEGLDPSKVF